MSRSPLLALVAVAAVAACTKREDPCSNDSQKAALANLVAGYYLYSPDLLPSSVDLGGYNTPADLLDGLTATARSQGKDRGWSYLTTPAAQQQFFTEGTFVGFGFGIVIPAGTTRLLVGQVYPNSSASAEFHRGDEIVAVGTADPLTPVSTLIQSDLDCAKTATSPDQCNALGDAFGPATLGLPRVFDVIPRGATSTTPVRRAMTKSTYGLDPVPAPVIIPRQDAQGNALPPAGYVMLRTFIAPATTPLIAAFQQFKDAGVTDVIVDLRYNGGGLVDTAQLLSNLLDAPQDGNTMFQVRYNRYLRGANGNATFQALPQSITPAHVAFLVSKASASAAELVPNVIAPTVRTALVGHQTYGKPVGQASFPTQCGTVVMLVAFQLSNSVGFGGYFDGLPSATPAPGFAGCGVAADDDFGHDLGDPAETQTAAALQWFANPSSCTTPTGPLAVSRATPLGGASGSPDDAYPTPARPTEAQRHLPGLF